MRNFPTAAGSLRDFSLRIRLQTTEIWSMPWGWNLCLKSGKDNWSFYFVLPHHNPFRGQLEYYLTTCFYCKEPASHPCFVLLLCMTYHFQHSCLILWHQNVQYHWDSLSSTTDLTFPLGFFCGLWHMGKLAVFIQQILLNQTLTASLHSIVPRQMPHISQSLLFPYL